MAGIGLSNFLDDSEIEKLPSEVKDKFDTFISTNTEAFNNLKSKYEKLRVNSEQQYFNIEKQLITSNGKLETESLLKNSLQEKLTQLESKHAETSKKLQELLESSEAFQNSEHEYKVSIQILENEKRDLHYISTKRSKEIDRLNEEIDQLNKKLSTANNEKCEAQAKANEAQSEEVARQGREKRLEKEKEALDKQIEWLNNQLTEKTTQLTTMRKEKTSHVLEIQSQLEEKSQELVHAQAVVVSLKESAEEHSKRMDSLIEKLREERESQVHTEEQFRQELAVQKRLIDLYKVSANENDSKVNELTGAVEELRKLLKEAASAYTELETTKIDEVNKLDAILKEKEESVVQLQQELKNANELIVAMKKGAITLTDEAVESLSPAAAATSKLLKSGMTLTQIYNEYVQATDSLNDEREENKRLNSYLEQILQEIEEKAPLLKKQREDYETALANLDHMTAQLDATMLECEKLRANADDMKRRFGHVQRECNKHQQTAEDLSKQVHHLLKEVEELRGGRIVRDDLNVSSSEVSSSSNIITEKLVTFRNIQELQEQNQRLIEVARELSEKKEAEENETLMEKTRELKEQLDLSVAELQQLKDARSRQAEMVESIVRQRDMYRVLLQQGSSIPEVSGLPLVTSTPIQTTAQAKTGQSAGSPKENRRELDDARNALKELQAEFDAYKKDKAENDKLLNESQQKSNQTLSDMRVTNTKLSTQLDFATERYKIVQNNAAGYKKEIDLLQDRCHKSSATILKHESAIAHLKEELMGAQENVARWQVQVENLQTEKELLKNSERRLITEIESMRREQTSQAMLMASLQAIKNNQERAEFEARTRHSNHVEGLEKEIGNLHRKLEASLEEKTRQATSWEDIVKTAQLELATEKEKQATLKVMADNAALEIETLKQELSTSESKLAAAELKLENLSTQANQGTDEESSTMESGVESEAVKDLKNQLAQQQILMKNLRHQLEAAKKHVNQYKTIADGVEQSLKDQNKASKEVQEACERKIQEAQREKDAIAKRLELLEKDHESALAENVRLTNESHSLHGDLMKQLAKLQHELEEAVSQKDAAMTNSEAAQNDCKAQAAIAAEAQNKYQRELMLHAADVEALTAVRKQLEDINEHLQQSQEETVIFEKQLTDAKTSWNEQERILKEELKVMETRCEQLTKQNSVLHDQMAKLGNEVVSIQQMSRGESVSGNTSFSEESKKSSEQLLEVIKYLRREKEIAETKLEVIQTECTRVKQRFAHIEKQAEDANKALAEERQRSQVNAETVANQVELMRKVSNLNVLTDSNKLLRDERDQLLNTKQELESKVRQLEIDIEPLQNKLRDLESQKETLTVERNSLQDEVNRWKNRTSNLIEQSHKTDPEEHKRLLLEKENVRRQLAQAKEENFKQRADLNRINSTNSALQTEINSLKQESTKISQEMTTLKKQLEDKTKEAEDKTMTINRLKQIGRKYKEQAEKVTKELEDVKVKAAGQESDKVNAASLEQTIAELRRTVMTNNSSIISLESQLTESQNEAQAAVKRAEQAAVENNTLKESVSTAQQELSKIQETNGRLKAEVDDFEKRASEFEKKQAQLGQVLHTARNKMMNQKAQIEKLQTENKEQKASLSTWQGAADDSEQVKAIKAQYDGRIARLEKDLEEARSSSEAHSQPSPDSQAQMERLQAENGELQAKIQQLQRQLEVAQHKHSPPQQPVAARPASSVAPSTTSSDAPKMANIKPMAPAASSSRQTVPITSHSPAAVKATASIRPMAISPNTTSGPSSGTPTATVMPTTVSQHDASSDADNLPGPSGLQQSSSIPAASVSGRIQIVEPHVVGEWNQEASVDQVVEEHASNQAVVTPSMQETVQVVNPTPVIATVSSAPQLSSSGVNEAVPHTTGLALGKRLRDDESFTQEDSDAKRSRMSTQDHPIPTINVIDENLQVVTQIQPQPSSTTQSQSQPPPSSQIRPGLGTSAVATTAVSSIASSSSSSSSSAGWQGDAGKDVELPQDQLPQGSAQTQVDTSQKAGGDDVIMVLSDEDEHQADDDGNVNDEEDEDFEDDDDDDDDDEEDEDVDDDNDDVVIIDMDEHQQQSQQQQQQQQQQAQSAPHQPLSHGERLPSVGRSQLTPFMLGSQGGLFEEDDCTVPSTPTLSQPRRADGFAEALNSPAVAQRFVFGSGVEGANNPDLAQLESQRALGMDDTRMDLSQFDEGGNRSAPSTPTPQIITTEAPASSQDVEEATLEMSQQSQEDVDPEESAKQTQDFLGMEGDDAEVAEEDDSLLEGEGEHEEEEVVEEEGDSEQQSGHQGSGEGPSRPGPSKDEADSSQERADAVAKPPIKKIVWDASQGGLPPTGFPAARGAAAAAVPLVQSTQQQQQQLQQQPRAQGLRRGGPSRGRGNQLWSQNPTRGNPFGSRGRGGRGFRGF